MKGILPGFFARVWKVMNDPDVLAEARKKGLKPSPISGDAVEGWSKSSSSSRKSFSG